MVLSPAMIGTAATVGSALGGLADIVGAGMDLFGGDDQGFDSHGYRKMIKINYKDRLYYARKYAEKYGFHPLTALGINPAMGGGFRKAGGRGRGRAVSNMGQGLERMLTGKSELDKSMARYYDTLSRKIQSDMDGIIEEDIIDPVKVGGSAKYTRPVKIVQSGLGREAGEQGAVKVTWSPEGHLLRAPTEGLEDFVSEDIYTKVKFHGPEFVRSFKTAFWNRNPNSRQALKHRNDLRDYLNGLEKSHPPIKGFYYVWDPHWKAVRRIRKNKYHKKQLFDTNKGLLSVYSRYIQKRSRVQGRRRYKSPLRRDITRSKRWKNFKERRRRAIEGR